MLNVIIKKRFFELLHATRGYASPVIASPPPTLRIPQSRFPTFLVLVSGIAQHLEKKIAIMVFIDPKCLVPSLLLK